VTYVYYNMWVSSPFLTATRGCLRLSSLQLTCYHKITQFHRYCISFYQTIIVNLILKTCHYNLIKLIIYTCQNHLTIFTISPRCAPIKTTHNHYHHPHMPLQSMYRSHSSTNLYHKKYINHATNQI